MSKPQTRSQRAAQIRSEFEAKERRRALLIYGGALAVVAGLIGLTVVGIIDAQKKSAAEASLRAGLGDQAAPPWPLPEDPAERVKLAGLELGPESTVDHYHSNVVVLVDGEPVPVIANLGVDSASGLMSALHTHSGDGLVHVEADKVGEQYTLGQLFTQWNVRLTAEQIGSLKAGKKMTLKAYVNGKEVAGNPASIRLSSRRQIVLVYGPAGEKVKLPASYKFPEGG